MLKACEDITEVMRWRNTERDCKSLHSTSTILPYTFLGDKLVVVDIEDDKYRNFQFLGSEGSTQVFFAVDELTVSYSIFTYPLRCTRNPREHQTHHVFLPFDLWFHHLSTVFRDLVSRII